MAQLHFTNKAVADLTEIWEYTVDKWSEKQADIYYQLIIDACNGLAANPTSGQSFTDVYSGLYGLRISRHIIFYRIIDRATIEIIRILHDQMDLKNRLKK